MQLIPDASLEWVFMHLCDAFRQRGDAVFFLSHPEREVHWSNGWVIIYKCVCCDQYFDSWYSLMDGVEQGHAVAG